MTSAQPPQGQTFVDDLYAISDGDRRYELVAGRLRVSEPAGWQHGEIAQEIADRLRAVVRAGGLGGVVQEVGFVLRRDPDTVRAPDVAFLRADRMPARDVAHRFIEGPPDIATEVVSPNDTASEVAAKVEEYLDAGTRLVWVVYPERRRVIVHTPDGISRLLRDDEVLDGGDVVPGFRLALTDLFGSAA